MIVTAGRDDALAWVRKNAGADDVVLVKASRAAALEWVAEQLLSDADVPDDGPDPTERNPTAP